MHLDQRAFEPEDNANRKPGGSQDVPDMWLPSGTARLWLTAAAAGTSFAVLSMALDLWLLKTGRWSAFSASAISHGIFAIIVTVLVFRVLAYGRERREKIVQRLETIDEMNHHIRNALQVISFSARAGRGKEEEFAEINQAVNRIQWALREIVPKLEPQFTPFEGSARQQQDHQSGSPRREPPQGG